MLTVLFCRDCYRRVTFVAMNYWIGYYSTWTGHDAKCPRFGKCPDTHQESARERN